MSTSSITASAQPIQTVEPKEVIVATDATTEKVDEMAIELFRQIQQIMLLPEIQALLEFAEDCEVVRLSGRDFVLVVEEQEGPLYYDILVSTQPNEETEPFIEEVPECDEPVATAPDVAPQPVLVAS